MGKWVLFYKTTFFGFGCGEFKFQFVGQGLCPWTPLKPFLKEGFKNPKNFQKDIFIIVF